VAQATRAAPMGTRVFDVRTSSRLGAAQTGMGAARGRQDEGPPA